MARANSTHRPVRMSPTQISRQIDAQRQVLFQATAILSCLGEALQDVSVKSGDAELQYVTDALIEMLNGAATRLEPLTLGLPTPGPNTTGADQ